MGVAGGRQIPSWQKHSGAGPCGAAGGCMGVLSQGHSRRHGGVPAHVAGKGPQRTPDTRQPPQAVGEPAEALQAGWALQALLLSGRRHTSRAQRGALHVPVLGSSQHSVMKLGTWRGAQLLTPSARTPATPRPLLGWVTGSLGQRVCELRPLLHGLPTGSVPGAPLRRMRKCRPEPSL